MDEFDESRLAKLALLKAMLERRDSIRVTRSTSGEFSFEVRRQYDANRTSPDEIIEQIERIYRKLQDRFSGQRPGQGL